ncbi:MAG: class I SAM-dependent methyltransferase [Edaphobacter sp.]|uniref:class I SAM-dependent methyltransferase n=1 Tax=Edaphobacter sp. TaxID=1934404 RepID=UPI00238A027B|nr:class I SAM-dependent methyltransferase [Edaphobacter sp.]MDE1175443.1 class I SAM-dependent methyltransferase [Edaphobacter sp.]
MGPVLFVPRPMFLWTSFFLLAEGLLYLLYVKWGKFRHRDRMLALHSWTGAEQVLDVGCGRGLLLAGAAKKIRDLKGSGHAFGIDIWSSVDMGANSEAATLRNLEIEGVRQLCSLESVAAQEMSFADESFDVIVSNLCLHNIYDRPTRELALRNLVRVLKPGGVALISDYKKTGEYAKAFEGMGLAVSKERGGFFSTFPPLTIVVARKPL